MPKPQANGARSSTRSNMPGREPRVPGITISDPMKDGAVYNMPLDSAGFNANDSPVYGRNHDQDDQSFFPRVEDLQRTNSSATGQTSPPLPPSSQDGTEKRLPRKLTKSRGNSETRPPGAGEQQVLAERPKGVLTKKPPNQLQSSVEDGTTDGSPSPPQ